jgi:hypothetical protein
MFAPGDAWAQSLSVEETEDLVRIVYFEGMPEAEVGRIGPEGCARLVEMLGDSKERANHGRILVAIGRCRPAGGFEAIRDWAEVRHEGEIDRATFRAWQALPYALGHLAEDDPRALAMLEARLSDRVVPAWTFRHHRGSRLVNQSRRSAATSLALTGLPGAGEALQRAGRSVQDERFREYLDEALDLHRRSLLENGEQDRNRRGQQ